MIKKKKKRKKKQKQNDARIYWSTFPLIISPQKPIVVFLFCLFFFSSRLVSAFVDLKGAMIEILDLFTL